MTSEQDNPFADMEHVPIRRPLSTFTARQVLIIIRNLEWHQKPIDDVQVARLIRALEDLVAHVDLLRLRRWHRRWHRRLQPGGAHFSNPWRGDRAAALATEEDTNTKT